MSGMSSVNILDLEGTPYAGGYFKVKFRFTEEFPAAPPKCTVLFRPSDATLTLFLIRQVGLPPRSFTLMLGPRVKSVSTRSKRTGNPSMA